ncbi:MAG: 3'-5' exonuclease [Lachnospiraceae bacterium]|nr:3'-5' exonuclease [Lachnospiraceae bacterium]
MNYIVFDLEWNQCPKGKEWAVDHFPFEIIEIGAVKLDDELRQIGEFRQLISPVVYTQLHYKICEVTHLDMDTLKREGVPFAAAMERFLAWCGEDYMFVTWGSMDLTELQRNMVYFGLEIPFPMPLLYYDLQKLYNLLYVDGPDKLSLDQAVEESGIPLEEERPFHHALDDAYYTALVMEKMDFDLVQEFVSMDYYRIPQCEAEEIYLKFPGYSKFVSREFEEREDALSDKHVTDMYCYKCNRMLRKKIRWFSVNPRLQVCLAVCPEHGLVRGKIRIKKSESGGAFAVRTTKFVDEEGAAAIAEKKEEVKKRRSEKNKLKKQARRTRAEK